MGDTKRRAEHLMEIKPCKGIQNFLNEASKILGNPMLAHDMEHKVIANTENTVTDDPIWNEYEATRTVSYDRLVFYRDEGFFEMAANAKKATFLHSDKLKYERILGKLFTKGNVQIGYLYMVACYKPFEEGDAELFEMVCYILSKEFYNKTFYQNYGQTYMETLINQLIGEGIDDTDFYTAQIESIYTGLNSTLHIAVADISKCISAFTTPARFRDLFKRTYPEFKYAIYSKHVVIIMSFEKETSYVKEALSKLNRIFRERNIYVGISGSFENLFNLQTHYEEAANALNYGTQYDSDKRIFLYDEVARDFQK